MNRNLFRQKSIDRVSSPEQLNDYIKVSSPGVWIVLAAVTILLLGACVWGIFGRLETTVPAVVLSQDGTTVCCYDASLGAQVQTGMRVRVNDAELDIKEVIPSVEPLPQAMAVDGYEAGQSVYVAMLDSTLPDGVYGAEIVVERIAPASFLWN